MALIDCTRHGDYLLPNIVLNESPHETIEPLGSYGRMRRVFLHEHRPITYGQLLLSEKLFPHLQEVDSIANERRECGVPEGIIIKNRVRNIVRNRLPEQLQAHPNNEHLRITRRTVFALSYTCFMRNCQR